MGGEVKVGCRNYVGIDFSGAASAGKKIWLAAGFEEGGLLKVTACRRAETLPGSGRDRETSFEALKIYLQQQVDTLIGLDFPFGIPQPLVKEKDWESFVRAFTFRYNSPEQFREICYEKAGGKELKRATDHTCRAPFSPYNLRVYKQTYYGIRELLYPLIRSEKVSVLPMHEERGNKPRLIEICPASTLKEANLYFGYKGREEEKQARRLAILSYLEKERNLVLDSTEMRDMVARDPDGDALDSLVALAAGFGAKPGRPAGDEWKVEGYTYY